MYLQYEEVKNGKSYYHLREPDISLEGTIRSLIKLREDTGMAKQCIHNRGFATMTCNICKYKEVQVRS